MQFQGWGRTMLRTVSMVQGLLQAGDRSLGDEASLPAGAPHNGRTSVKVSPFIPLSAILVHLQAPRPPGQGATSESLSVLLCSACQGL